jgi:hypothetical protein
MQKIAFIIACLFCTGVFAADTPPTSKVTHDPKMQKFMDYATPSEGHKILKDMEGNWAFTMKSWMEPGAQPEESKGKSVNKLIMNGKFIQQDVTGTAMGKPFKGMGLMGFNNMKKAYETTWIDNMGTGMMKGTATWDSNGKTIAEKGEFSCPMTDDKERDYRSQTKFTAKNMYTYEMYTNGPDGKEFKMMEINYKRQ